MSSSQRSIVMAYGVRKIVQRTAAKSVKMIVAALERGRTSAVRPGATCRSKLSRGRPSSTSTAKSGILAVDRYQGSLQDAVPNYAQAVLVLTRDQCRARSGTNSGVGVSLHKAQSSCGYTVDVWRAEIRAPITGHVGIAEIFR
jgi:hypothetical protein